jgi:hypothetical protein
VLGFFAFAWGSLIVILLVEPEIYDSAIKLPAGKHPLADLAFLGGISAFIVFLSVGVLRSWRWACWLILVAFLISGGLRTPSPFSTWSGSSLRSDLRGTPCSRLCSTLFRSGSDS